MFYMFIKGEGKFANVLTINLWDSAVVLEKKLATNCIMTNKQVSWKELLFKVKFQF